MSYFTRGDKWLYKFNPETIKICAENEYAFGLVIDTLVCTDILLKYMLTCNIHDSIINMVNL